MLAIPNQSSVPSAYELFTKEDAEEGGSRVMLGGDKDHLVDCVEEFVKYTINA
jgi:arsenic resistance protein ArsH